MWKNEYIYNFKIQGWKNKILLDISRGSTMYTIQRNDHTRIQNTHILAGTTNRDSNANQTTTKQPRQTNIKKRIIVEKKNNLANAIYSKVRVWKNQHKKI